MPIECPDNIVLDLNRDFDSPVPPSINLSYGLHLISNLRTGFVVPPNPTIVKTIIAMVVLMIRALYCELIFRAR